MIIKPMQLQLGDTIGIISPSSVLKQEDIQPSINRLREMGFQIKIAKNAFKDTYSYAASPEERAEDFNEMIADSTVKMLLFDGGEVCNEILPFIDFSIITENPKIICSYSDSTTILNAIYALSKVETFYGQSIQTFFNLTDYNLRCFKTSLMDNGIPNFYSNSKWEIIYEGKCEGKLIGGYLVNFAFMLNGDYFKYNASDKYILFIEDHICFSNLAAISKYFSHIEQSGFLNCVSGLIFGHYSDEPEPVIDEILERLSIKYNIPAVKCDDFGHGKNNAIIPIGIHAELDTQKRALVFKETLLNPVQ